MSISAASPKVGARDKKPVLVDVFCGAGGCSRGYQRAGFYVIGVDLGPQPRYVGDEFVQGDALEYLGSLDPDVVAVSASPPCQAYSVVTGEHRAKHPDLVAETRRLLRMSGLPYVIENVPGAPLENPVQLCGSAFGLPLRRHRLFETNFPLMAPGCAHGQMPDRFDVYEHGRWYKRDKEREKRIRGESQYVTKEDLSRRQREWDEQAARIKVHWQARAEAAEAQRDALREGIDRIARWCENQGARVLHSAGYRLRSLLSTQEPTR